MKEKYLIDYTVNSTSGGGYHTNKFTISENGEIKLNPEFVETEKQQESLTVKI